MLSLAPHRPSLQSSIVCGGPVVNWPAQTQCTRLFTSVDGRNGRLQDNKPTAVKCHPSLSSKNVCHTRQLRVGLLKYEAVLLNLQLRPIQRHPYNSKEVSNFFLHRIKNSSKQNKKYIRKVSVCFVKCHEWHVACNRPTLDRVSTLQVSGVCRPHCLYDVTTILASVCVVSLFKVLLSCSRVWTAFCDTLWHNTNAISIDIIIRRRETVHRHRRSVCLWAISLPMHFKLYGRA